MNTSEPAVDAKERTIDEARIDVDPTWKGVYKVGGACALAIGLAYFIGAVLSIIIGPPPSGGELYLKSLAGHAVLSQINFGAFALADFLMLPAGMALFLALKHRAKNAMLLGAGIMVMAFVFDLAVTELNSLTLVALTQQYAAATSEVQRSAYVAAADYALATLPIATFCSYVVSSAGLLVISVVMLGGVFSRPTAYLGIAAGIEGIVGGFYIFLPALAVLLVPCLITFGIWLLLTGSRLYALGK